MGERRGARRVKESLGDGGSRGLKDDETSDRGGGGEEGDRREVLRHVMMRKHRTEAQT